MGYLRSGRCQDDVDCAGRRGRHAKGGLWAVDWGLNENASAHNTIKRIQPRLFSSPLPQHFRFFDSTITVFRPLSLFLTTFLSISPNNVKERYYLQSGCRSNPINVVILPKLILSESTSSSQHLSPAQHNTRSSKTTLR